MFKRLLVPLDGSRFAEVAAPVGVSLAARSGGEVRFVVVHEPALRGIPGPDGAVPMVEDDRERRTAEASYLAEIVDRSESRPPVTLSTALIDGLAATALTEEANTWRADLVVMASHGRGPLSRWWLGSVADYLIRHVHVPILLLRPRDGVDWPATDLHLRTILVPLDQSVSGEAILEPVIAFAKLFDAKVELVHVVEPVIGLQPTAFPYPLPPNVELDDRDRTEAQVYLDRVAERVRASGVGVVAKVTFGPSIATGLLELAEEDHCDMVALATHGAGGLKRALVGSVADKVIRGLHKPVLILRPTE